MDYMDENTCVCINVKKYPNINRRLEQRFILLSFDFFPQYC